MREYKYEGRTIVINDNATAEVIGNGCKVKVIEYSKNPFTGQTLLTYQLKYWRSIHSEMMTHRMFSRNASSSRAIPIKTFIKQVWSNPAGPIHWGANQPGMKARTELTGIKKWLVKTHWNLTGKINASSAYLINFLAKPHKQTVNRMLESHQYIDVILTATEYDNFFELRDHPDAQPEIAELAKCMKIAKTLSFPVIRTHHLPYVSESERETESLEIQFKMATARCARVSYLTHDGKTPNRNKDIKLHDDLVMSIPRHQSPAEHSAIAQESSGFYANFKDWKQYRSIVDTMETEVLK